MFRFRVTNSNLKNKKSLLRVCGETVYGETVMVPPLSRYGVKKYQITFEITNNSHSRFVYWNDIHTFSISNTFKCFYNLLNFSWTELQILLRCCLIHISILDLGLSMSYLCDMFFIFIFFFIMINRIISWIQRNLFFHLIF